MMVIDNLHEIGDIVYLKTDKEQSPRIVYAFTVYNEGIVYKLCAGTFISEHYSFEISKEVNYLTLTT